MTVEGNRITDPTSVANEATDKQLAPVSPTGTAFMPQVLVRIATVLVLIAGVIVTLPTAGISLPPAVMAAASAVMAIGTVLGISSQGVRRSEK